PAPMGANEYVDIDIDLLRLTDIKYLVISNNAFDSSNLCDYKECYSGITSYDKNNVDKFITEDITFKTNITSKDSTSASILIIINPENIEIISIDMNIQNARYGFSKQVNDFASNLIRYATTYAFFTIYDLLEYGIYSIYGKDVEFVRDKDSAHKSISMGIDASIVETYLGK
ncbi:MAG: hypothetical protein ACRCXT_22115, partial [Paraclostridium sp.]